MTITDGGALLPWNYKLLSSSSYEDDYVFGRNTNMLVSRYTDGPFELTENTAANPRANGRRFGREYYGGMTITFEGDIWTNRSAPGDPVAALDQLAKARAAWTPAELQRNPGKITALRMNRGGRKRRVYGRPGVFDATNGRGSKGWIPYQSTFRCVDHLYYDDAEYSEIIPFIPEEVGGLIGPLIGPISSTGGGAAASLLTVRGEKPSWLTTRIYGPIADPIVIVQNQWSYRLSTTIADGDFVTVDPTPWQRSVRHSNGANYAGKFDSTSMPLSLQSIFPGPNSITMIGNDPTGTSKLEVFWRDTYSSY